MPRSLRCCVVYKFTCADVILAMLVIQADTSTRVHEYLYTDKNSIKLKHLKSSSACRMPFTESYVKVIDSTNTYHYFKTKEASYML